MPRLTCSAARLAAALFLVLPCSALAARPAETRRARPASVNDFDGARRLDLNQVNMAVTNYGAFAWNPATGSAGFVYPRGSGNVAVFASGLWLGARVNGVVRVAVAEYSSEFAPGAMVGSLPDDPNRPEYRTWKVSRFRGDPSDIAEVYRTAAELAADPDLDPLLHHSWADYVANAGPYGAPTRVHRLPDWNTPAPDDSMDVLGPDVSGDMMLWSVCNDAEPAYHYNDAGSTAPLGVEVQQSTFAFDHPGPFGRTVFVRFKVINKGGNLLQDMYAGAWSDPDLGDFLDDLTACDPASALGYVYNSDPVDGTYGASPPAVGYDLLLGPMVPGNPAPLSAFTRYINGTDPTSSLETYNYMRGLNANGTTIVNPVTGLPTTYMFDGDPVTGAGWLDTVPSDRRFLLSKGPFVMAPGDTEEVLVAIVVGQGGGFLHSVSQLRCADGFVQSEFDAGLHPQPPVTDPCPVPANCTRPAGFWAAECEGGAQLAPGALERIASCEDAFSVFFDWSPDVSGLCAVLGVPDLDPRTQAKREFAALLANVCAGAIGTTDADGRAINLKPATPISCSGIPDMSVASLVTPARPGLEVGDYLDLNPAHPPGLAGANFGLPRFGGGAGTGRDFLGSTLDPVAHRDSFMTVELRFSTSTRQKGHRYLRLETLSTGGPPPQGRGYMYGGFHDVNLTCWDVESGVQLDVGFVERAVTDDAGTLLGPGFQPATFDSTWAPDESTFGSREYLLVFNRPYSGVPKAELAQDYAFVFVPLPVLYVLAARKPDPGAVVDDGDAFRFEFGYLPGPGVDRMLIVLEGQPLSDPAVQQAYQDIVDCLSAINAGIGIGPTCDQPTDVMASLLSAQATPDRVALTWQVSAPPGAEVGVERAASPGSWTALGGAIVDAEQRVSFEDRDVVPGRRYGYRLVMDVAGRPAPGGEAWLDVPDRAVLAIPGARPNPASWPLAVTFSLASREPALLELLDVAGRRLASRPVGGLGPGSHVLVLGGGPRPAAGVYVLRLTQGGRTVTAKTMLLN